MTWCMIILYILIAVALAGGVFVVFAKMQGEGRVVFDLKRRTRLKVIRGNEQGVEMSCSVPYRNEGRQMATLVDVFTRHYMPREQYSAVGIDTNFYRVSDPRYENYWDAKVYYPGEGDDAVIEIRLIAKDGNIVEALAEMPDLPLDIFQKTCSRSDYYYARTYCVFGGDEIRAALEDALSKETEDVQS